MNPSPLLGEDEEEVMADNYQGADMGTPTYICPEHGEVHNCVSLWDDQNNLEAEYCIRVLQGADSRDM